MAPSWVARRDLAMARTAWTPAALAGLGLFAGALALAGCRQGPQLPRLSMPTIQQPPACVDFSISIYFEPASSAITHDADALIRSAAGRAKTGQGEAGGVGGLAAAAGRR